MIIYPDEPFEKYWKKRQYKHPEEKKIKYKCRMLYYAGFRTGIFLLRKQNKDYDREIKELKSKLIGDKK